MLILPVIGGLVALLIWLAIVFARGGFWSVRRHLLPACEGAHRPVQVCAVIPARNEADTIVRTVTALLRQKFNGTLRVIIVDDDSEDGTATVATRAAIRSEIIDDCALAKAIKGSGGRVWLGLADVSSSLRPYKSGREIRRMIERTAFKQLKHSTPLLIGTAVGLLLTFVLPVALLLSGSPAATVLATAAIVLMLASYVSMVLYYGLLPIWSLALPASACFYLWATLQSAWNFYRGNGGQWKGRSQDHRD